MNILNGIFVGITFVIIFIILLKKRKQQDLSKIENFIEQYKKIIFTSILMIGILARGIGLTSLPEGYNVDEAGMAYDARCISEYGTDRLGNSFPVYFTNFGQGQSALYTYLTAGLIKIFGFSKLIVRLPAFLLSIVALICVYVVTKKNKNNIQAVIVMSLLAICPWHIMQSRFGLDCNLLSSMLIISILALVQSKKWYQYILTGILFGITLYTYALSYFILPIFLALTLLYMLWTKKIKFRNVILLGIPIAILAIPLLLVILYNNGMIAEPNLGILTVPKLLEYRVGEFDLKNIEINSHTIFNKLLIYDDLSYNAIKGIGPIYLFTVPLAFLGILIAITEMIKSIKQRKMCLDSIFLFNFIACLICAFVLKNPNINRINAIYIPIIYFTMLGMYEILKNSKKLTTVIIALLIIEFGVFLKIYFVDYPVKEKLRYFGNPLGEIVQQVPKDKKIYIEADTQEDYIYLIIDEPIPPQELKESVIIKNHIFVDNYRNYDFRLPKVIEKDAAYIIKNTAKYEALIEKIREAGFQEKIGKDYVVFY